MAPRRPSGALIAEPVAPRRNPRRHNRDRDSPIRHLILEQIREDPLPRRAHPRSRPSCQPSIILQSSPLPILPTTPAPAPPPTPPQQTPHIQDILTESSPPHLLEEPLSVEDAVEAVKVKDGRSVNHTIAQRLQALALAEAGIAMKQAAAMSGLHNAQSVKRLQQKARARGYDPTVSTILKSEYVCDAPRSGRPLIFTAEKEAEMLAAVRKDRNGREKPAAVLGYEAGCSSNPILRALKRNGFRSVKTTKKPGLTAAMMQARFAFAVKYKDWTIEDWKKVIWTDETSVLLGARRGKVRVWRTPKEAYNPTVIRNRWKGFSEFMFWGSFTYDKKGPCHVWQKETAAQKKASKAYIDALNEALEPKLKAEWELNTAMARMGLRKKGGKKPQWKWDKAHGKIVRNSKKGGIDWYRYQTVILLKKLIPFAQSCGPEFYVMEDKAPAHASKHQDQIFMDANVLRLMWCGNSPDLNPIESCWYWMKRQTTRKGCPRTRKILTKVWERTWAEELSQKRIQAWIERLPRHIEKVLELRGGNEYREGKDEDGWTDIRPYKPVEHQQNYQSRKKGIRPGDIDVSGVAAGIEAAHRAVDVDSVELCEALKALEEAGGVELSSPAGSGLGLGLDDSIEQDPISDEITIDRIASDIDSDSDSEDSEDSG